MSAAVLVQARHSCLGKPNRARKAEVCKAEEGKVAVGWVGITFAVLPHPGTQQAAHTPLMKNGNL